MKLKNYVFAALALSIMSGCSEDEITGNGTGNQTEADSDAYVSVKINLPTGSSSTRGLTEAFEDGIRTEYDVKDLTLLFFTRPSENATEDEYVIANIASTLEDINTVEGAFILPEFTNNDNSEITTTASTSAISVNSGVCAVAALLNIKSEKSIAKTNLRIGKTFGEINEALTLDVNDIIGDTGFLMTSSPWLNSDKESAVNLTACIPQSTIDDAEKENNKVSVKVERIVSKVQLLAYSGDKTADNEDKLKELAKEPQNQSQWYKISDQMAYIIGGTGGHAGDIVIIEGWTLDVTNRRSYPFRKVDVTDWKTNSDIWPLISLNNRMYFAKDPNYDSYIPADFNVTTLQNASFKDAGTAQYCLENTFDINNQKKNQTTRLLIKAKYIPNENNSADDNGTWYSLNGITAHYSKTDLNEKIYAIGKELNLFDEEYNSSNVTINLTDVEENGRVKVGSVTVSDKSLTENELEILNNQLTITCYNNGYCYYPIRIRHFSDNEVYGEENPYHFPGNYTAKELGRYGVVRNTSYQVKIKTISKPGDPDVPLTPDEPDDDENLYISCTIDILAWALRPTQEENL